MAQPKDTWTHRVKGSDQIITESGQKNPPKTTFSPWPATINRSKRYCAGTVLYYFFCLFFAFFICPKNLKGEEINQEKRKPNNSRKIMTESTPYIKELSWLDPFFFFMERKKKKSAFSQTSSELAGACWVFRCSPCFLTAAVSWLRVTNTPQQQKQDSSTLRVPATVLFIYLFICPLTWRITSWTATSAGWPPVPCQSICGLRRAPHPGAF